MTNIALDTNAYRALYDGNKNVARLVRTATEIGIPVVVIGELLFGIFNGSRQAESQEVLRKFVSRDRVQILHITTETARLFGEIATELKKAGKPIQQNDIWIAALCKQHGYTLLTPDGGFSHIVGLDVISFN